MSTYRIVVDWQWLTRIEGNQYITDSSLQINEIESHREKRSVHVFPHYAYLAQCALGSACAGFFKLIFLKST